MLWVARINPRHRPRSPMLRQRRRQRRRPLPHLLHLPLRQPRLRQPRLPRHPLRPPRQAACQCSMKKMRLRLRWAMLPTRPKRIAPNIKRMQRDKIAVAVSCIKGKQAPQPVHAHCSQANKFPRRDGAVRSRRRPHKFYSFTGADGRSRLNLKRPPNKKAPEIQGLFYLLITSVLLVRESIAPSPGMPPYRIARRSARR